jgi:ribonuclease G
MGGIIVVDFIDMKKFENRRAIQDAMRDQMAKDRAKHAILPMSRFGLIQITRQRVRPEVNIQTEEVCPTCNGSGRIDSSVLLEEVVRKNVDFLLGSNKCKKLKLKANPYLAAYLTKGLFFSSQQWKWAFKYKKWVKIEASSKIPFTEVHYLDENEQEIKLT